jgi:hypothetical protein
MAKDVYQTAFPFSGQVKRDVACGENRCTKAEDQTEQNLQSFRSKQVYLFSWHSSRTCSGIVLTKCYSHFPSENVKIFFTILHWR